MISLENLKQLSELQQKDVLENLIPIASKDNLLYGVFDMSFMPDYENGIDLNIANEGDIYEVQEDGWFFWNRNVLCTGNESENSIIVEVLDKNNNILFKKGDRNQFQSSWYGYGYFAELFFPVYKGLKIKVLNNQTYRSKFEYENKKFFPLKKD